MRATEGLREALEALPLVIDEIEVSSARVELAGYPGGQRPTSTVVVRGRGLQGYGEHVGWTEGEHATFREHVSRVARGASSVGDWSARLAVFPPYDRAALEAAAIDLALRQQGCSMPGFAGAAPRPVRYVRSFDRTVDLASLAARPGEVKVDVDPAWSDEQWRSLAKIERVAVLDFKLAGDRDVLERAHRWIPGAWFEDPPGDPRSWPTGVAARWSADAPVTSLAALRAMSPRPAAVNVKAPRLGGVLEAIACLEWCARLGLVSYVGGMFEIGVGRRQSLALATVFTSEGPNDIAPLAESAAVAAPAQSPGGDARARASLALLDPLAPGFAGNAAA